MPTSAPGSDAARRQAALGRQGGFTLLELLVVVALIAMTTALAALALRDGTRDRLEQEAVRLSAMLEAARLESRTQGQPITWRPLADGGFRFEGRPPLPPGARSDGESSAGRWLNEQTRAEIIATGPPPVRVTLGPDPLIGRQRIRLRLEDQQLIIATDGLAAFRIESEGSP